MESQNTAATGSKFDSLLLLVAFALIAGGMGAFYYFVNEFNSLVRTAALLGVIALALAIAYQTEMGRTVWSYITGSRQELRKVVWPTRQETVQATLMIAVVVLILALVLWALDSFLLWGVKGLTGRG